MEKNSDERIVKESEELKERANTFENFLGSFRDEKVEAIDIACFVFLAFREGERSLLPINLLGPEEMINDNRPVEYWEKHIGHAVSVSDSFDPRNASMEDPILIYVEHRENGSVLYTRHKKEGIDIYTDKNVDFWDPYRQNFIRIKGAKKAGIQDDIVDIYVYDVSWLLSLDARNAYMEEMGP